MEEKPSGSAKAAPFPRTLVLWAAGCLAALVLLAAAAYLIVPYPVSVNGQTRWVRLGASLAALQSAGVITSRPGDLLSVRMKVLTRGGGDPATIYLDGRIVGLQAQVWPGSTVRTVNGTDRTEKVVTRRIALPITSRYIGHGPVVTMSQAGAVGVEEVTEGAVSGAVLSSNTVTPAVPAVFVRTKTGVKGRVIALTFDDGPQSSSTPAILSILRQYKVKATFFMVGREALRHPALARSVRADGHLIANHSYSHTSLGHAPYKTVVEQIGWGASTIKRATGATPTWFRPPGGSLSKTVYQVAQADAERVILWSIDPNDWKRPAPSVIVQWVVTRATPGAVVIMHDGGGNRANTIAALPQIITKLRGLGYQFVTLDQMFGAKPAAAPSKAGTATAAAP